MIDLLWFLLSITSILVIARKNLPLALIAGSIILGIFFISPEQIIALFVLVLTDPAILLLALTVAIIPMIGGLMEETGLMGHLVENLRIGKKGFLAFAPALLGMLPMPGGALMSAPLIEKAGRGVPAELKAAANVWFRHIMLIVYPLAPSLIASAKISGIDLYAGVFSLVPFFIFSIVLGYWFFLRKVTGKLEYKEKFSLKWLLVPLAIILSAPIIDIVFKAFIQTDLPDLITAFAVLIGLILVYLVGKPKFKTVSLVFWKMKPWKFSLIIFGMFFLLYVFQATPLPQSIAVLPLSPALLLVGLGVFLGFATGKITTPVSIVVPIFFAKELVIAMPLVAFAIMYYSIFVGYIISPVHPCVSVSNEFFKSDLTAYIKTLAMPSILSIVLMFTLAFLFL